MRLSQRDVLDAAFEILDTYGLGDLTMRRLAAQLGVQPGGLYWHFANKQTLLAAMADEIIADSRPGSRPVSDWRSQTADLAQSLRKALLVHRDGAEIVLTARALRMTHLDPSADVVKVLESTGLDHDQSRAGARALVHYVLGHTSDEQAHHQLRQLGVALEDDLDDQEDQFERGLQIFLNGLDPQQINADPS